MDPYTLHYFHFPVSNLNLKVIFTQNLEFQSSLLVFSCEDKVIVPFYTRRKSCVLYYFPTLFLFPQLKLSKPTRYFSRLSWAKYKFLNRSSQQSPPKLIHKWSTDFENPGDNDSKFKDHFKVYRSTN